MFKVFAVILIVSASFSFSNDVVAGKVFSTLKQTAKKARETAKKAKDLSKKSKANTSVNSSSIDPSTYFYFYPFVAQPLRESSNLNEKLRKEKNDKCLKILKTKSNSPIFKKPDVKSIQIGEYSLGEKVCLRKQSHNWIATNYGWIEDKNVK